MTSTRTVIYPPTRVVGATETLSDVSFPDPYRWLEENSEEVRAWQQAQADLSKEYVRQWPHFDRLHDLVARFSTDHAGQFDGQVPRYAGGIWFRTHIEPGGAHGQALVANSPFGAGRVLFDPMAENRERTPFLAWIAPSPDGSILALGICWDGGETNSIRLIDVATGCQLPDAPPQTVMDSVAQWLPDSSGFFFSGVTGRATDFEQRVFLHRRFPTPSTVEMNIAWTQTRDWRWAVVSRDGRCAVAFERLVNPIPVAIADLREAHLRWRPFITTVEGALAGHVLGERFVAVTDVGAPRGRVVAIDLHAEHPNDPESWQELVPESEAVIRTLTPVGQWLYLSELVNTYARVRVADLCGRVAGEVPLPGRGALGAEWSSRRLSTLPKGHPEKFLFTFSSLTASPGLFSHTPGQEHAETLQEPRVRLENAVVEDRSAIAADGKLIPYHVVRLRHVDTSRPKPTLIWAYGAFNSALVPQFPGSMAAFVAVGGVFVHAHLRGGGELGLEWWEAGRLKNKQTSFDDLYAVAEDLIARNQCTAQSLAMTGSSAGGLLAGVAATQRPDLWKVVVPRVARFDLVGGCREPYGLMCTETDRAKVDDPREVRRLSTFSPYHLVRAGVCYPAMYIVAGSNDSRCPAWHARKFAARLQREGGGSAPILLHVRQHVGHGSTTDRDTSIIEDTEWLVFTLTQLGFGSQA